MSREDWEVFDLIKEERRAKRYSNLEKNSAAYGNDPTWTKHTQLHWSKYVSIRGTQTRVDYWPSSNKWKVDKRYYRGGLPKDLKALIHGQ